MHALVGEGGRKEVWSRLGRDATALGHGERTACSAALVAALGMAAPAHAVAQEEGLPAANAPSRKIFAPSGYACRPICLSGMPFSSSARARVEAGGTIRADGHNLDLYGMELVRRNRICAPEGV